MSSPPRARSADTSSRSEKVAILAELLSEARAGEVPIAVGFLTGVPRQGRVGVGYSTIYGIERPAAEHASLTIDDLDRAIEAVQEATGSGSAARRKADPRRPPRQGDATRRGSSSGSSPASSARARSQG